jgi:hypothetical protein
MSKASLPVNFPLSWAGFLLDPVLQPVTAMRPATTANEINHWIVLFMPSYVLMSLPPGDAGHKHNLRGFSCWTRRLNWLLASRVEAFVVLSAWRFVKRLEHAN